MIVLHFLQKHPKTVTKKIFRNKWVSFAEFSQSTEQDGGLKFHKVSRVLGYKVVLCRDIKSCSSLATCTHLECKLVCSQGPGLGSGSSPFRRLHA